MSQVKHKYFAAEVRPSTFTIGMEAIGYAELHRRFPRRFETVRDALAVPRLGLLLLHPSKFRSKPARAHGSVLAQHLPNVVHMLSFLKARSYLVKGAGPGSCCLHFELRSNAGCNQVKARTTRWH
jgi:hypothetical protein